MESLHLKIATCTIEQQQHHHHNQPVEDDHEEFNIEIVITNDNNKTTSSFTLPLEDPHQLVNNPDDIFELVWDNAMEDLDNLDVDPSFRPKIIQEIASACLKTCTNNIKHPKIVLLLESVNPKEVITNLLLENGVMVNACLPCSCAICLEEVVSCRDIDTGGDEAGTMVAKLKCSHLYHLDCLVDWVLKCGSCDSSTFSCPLCRSSLFESVNDAMLVVKSLIGIK